MPSQTCPSLNKQGNPCGGWVPDEYVYCSVHDPERWCGHVKDDGEICQASAAAAGGGKCMEHADPVGQQGRKLRGRVNQFAARERRRPPAQFYDEGWHLQERTPELVRRIAGLYDVAEMTVRRWFAQAQFEAAQRALAAHMAEHGPVDDPQSRELPKSVKKLGPEHLDFLVEDFIEFRGVFFEADVDEPYLTPPFQQRWVRAIFETLVFKKRQVILSPPRHGKTDLLVHVCVYLICHWPNIRILWVAGNERIAGRSVAAVQGILENNQKLIDAFAPSAGFRPQQRGGKKWTRTEFQVETQTLADGKRVTMTAIGRGGNTRSLDADIVVADDIEDHGSTAAAGAREGTREWWTIELESRKMAHTGLFAIGSRVHVDDLNGKLLESEAYDHIVEHAHDPECAIDPKDDDAHVDCMLFPDLVPYKHLMGLKKAAENTGGPAYFQMVYQNIAQGLNVQVFPPEIVDGCKDPTYTIGERPPGTELVAGLDPSGSGFQAAFLWAYKMEYKEGHDPKLRMWMMDIQNNLGGGVAEARKTVEEWWDLYRVDHWVVEENLYQGAIVDDEILRDFRATRGIQMEGFKTYRNKVDPLFGVTSLQPLMVDKTITLPYSEKNDSQDKTDSYRAQLIYWDASASRNRNTKSGYKSDLVMASWFPMEVIRRVRMDFVAEMGADYGDYPGWDFGTAPWGDWAA